MAGEQKPVMLDVDLHELCAANPVLAMLIQVCRYLDGTDECRIRLPSPPEVVAPPAAPAPVVTPVAPPTQGTAT